MSNPIIYVVIVTWNGMRWIDRCLCAIRESTYPVYTIVIDNGSTDNTAKHIKALYPEVELYVMDHNLGFGQANNFGMNIARQRNCDYVYLLNQDAYVYSDMFMKLIEAHVNSKDNSIGILSPLHLHDGTRFDSHFKIYAKDIYPELIEDLILGTPKQYYLTDGVPAAGWLIPRNTLETIGGFDPIFYHYDEDGHYIQRMKFHKKKTAIVPTARMIHDREEFGNIKMAFRDQTFRSLKTYYFLNINLDKWDLLKKLSHVILAQSVESMKHLLNLDINKSLEFPKGLMRNIANIREYRKDRKINRQIGPIWLNKNYI